MVREDGPHALTQAPPLGSTGTSTAAHPCPQSPECRRHLPPRHAASRLRSAPQTDLRTLRESTWPQCPPCAGTDTREGTRSGAIERTTFRAMARDHRAWRRSSRADRGEILESEKNLRRDLRQCL